MPEAKRNFCPHVEGIEKGNCVVWVDEKQNPNIGHYKTKYGYEFNVDAVTMSATGGCTIVHVSRNGICLRQFPAWLFRKKP